MQKKRLSQLATMLELLEQKIDVQKLLDNVAFHEADFISAAFDQANLMKSVQQLRVQYMHRRMALETKVSLKVGLLTQKYRNVREKGKRAHTEGAVKAIAEMHPDVIALRKRLNKAYAKEEMAKGLVEVFRTRKDMIRAIIDAGRISLQEKELALLTGNKKLRSAVRHLMNRHTINEV